MALMLCELPRARNLSLMGAFFRSTEYVALTVAAGAAAIAAVWFFLGERPQTGPARISSNMGVGWVFLPCIALLYWERSAWMLVGVVLATLGAVFSVRRLFPVGRDADAAGVGGAGAELTAVHESELAGVLPSLYGLPPDEVRLSRAAWIAVSAQGALTLAALGYLLLAGLLFAASAGLLVWQWSALNPDAARWWMGRRPPVPHAAFAILMTAFALLPWVVGRIGGILGRSEGLANPAPEDRKTPQADAPSYGYVGIVLWPPEVKKREIVPPRPHSDLFGGGAMAKPVTIPFDGPYWYFKVPSDRPGPRARVTRGKPTELNVRSTDWDRLLMEAHQNVGLPIDLSCCSEIDVAITNADLRPGAITMELLLTDSGAAKDRTQDVGAMPIPSSEFTQIPAGRAPVKETLRFAIPRTMTLKRFDEMTVRFRPSADRARVGAKVSIDSFELVPKR
jgi:hypothetical protein